MPFSSLQDNIFFVTRHTRAVVFVRDLHYLENTGDRRVKRQFLLQVVFGIDVITSKHPWVHVLNCTTCHGSRSGQLQTSLGL